MTQSKVNVTEVQKLRKKTIAKLMLFTDIHEIEKEIVKYDTTFA